MIRALVLLLLLASFAFASEPSDYSSWSGDAGELLTGSRALALPNNSYYVFEPKPDITAWELAQILNKVLIPAIAVHSDIYRHWDWDEMIMELGTAARHFKRFPTQ